MSTSESQNARSAESEIVMLDSEVREVVRGERMGSPVDLRLNRGSQTFKNKLARVVWQTVNILLYRPSPKICHGWRRMLLRLFGAKIHPTAKIFHTTKVWAPWNLIMDEYAVMSYDVDCYSVTTIHVHPHATISQYCFICAASHDFTDPGMKLTTAPISIGAGSWICADVFIAPGVTIGDGAVVGARSSVFKDVPPMTIVAGSPARVIGPRVMAKS